MAIALEGSQSTTAYAPTLTIPLTTSGGNLLVLNILHQSRDSVAVSDTAGNTWIQAANTADDGATAQRIESLWYCADADPITSVTVTAPKASALLGTVSEWAGAATLEAANSVFSPGGGSRGADVSASARSLAIGAAATYNSTPTVTNGYTPFAALSIATTEFLAAYKIVSTAGSAGPHFTADRQTGVATAAFTEAVSPAGGAATTVSVTTIGSGVGSETPSSGAATSIDVVTTGAGIGVEVAHGGASATVTVTATGGGSFTEIQSASGGSAANVGVSTTGAGQGTEHPANGSATTVTATATGSGVATAHNSGGSATTVTVTSTGGGATESHQDSSGGAAVPVGVTSSGAGSAAELVTSGSASTITVTATGTGLSSEAAHGGDATTVTITAHGAGLAVENVPPVTRGIDISVSVGGSRRNGEVGMSRISGTIFAADETRLDDTVGDTRQSTTIAPTIQHRKAQ